MLDPGFAGGRLVADVHQLASARARPTELSAAARALRDAAHAALHTGPWREVDMAWREAYMFAALHLAQSLRPAPSRDAALDAVGILDLGLMLGSTAFRPQLLAAIASLEACELADERAPAPRPLCSAGPWLAKPLPAGSAGSIVTSGFTIARLERPSLERFFLTCMAAGQPAVLTGVTDGWPAMGPERSWRDLGYLKTVAGHRLVPVEVGANYLASDWTEELMTLGSFIDEFLVPHSLLAAPDSDGSAPPLPPLRTPESVGGSGRRAYLAQHALLEQVPALARDIAVPDYCSLSTLALDAEDDSDTEAPAGAGLGSETRVGDNVPHSTPAAEAYDALRECRHEPAPLSAPSSSGKRCHPETESGTLRPTPRPKAVAAAMADEAAAVEAAEHSEPSVRVNVWLGPGGTVSPLHHDPEHNLLVQLVGAKYVRLYAPSESDRLYAHTEGLHKVSSQVVNVHEVDAARFPLFAGARFFDTVLRAGETLYIPPRWWHYVEATQPSCSLSFWWM